MSRARSTLSLAMTACLMLSCVGKKLPLTPPRPTASASATPTAAPTSQPTPPPVPTPTPTVEPVPAPTAETAPPDPAPTPAPTATPTPNQPTSTTGGSTQADQWWRWGGTPDILKPNYGATPTPTPTPTPLPTPKPTATPASQTTLDTIAADVVQRTNAYRQQNNLPALTVDDHLTTLAQFRSQDMADHNYFSHTSLDGKTASDLLTASQYTFSVVRENIAKIGGYADDQIGKVTMDGWIASSGHKANLLATDVSKLGVGVAKCGDGTWILTQVFTD